MNGPILVIDDDTVRAEAVSRVLRRGGHDVRVAHTAREGVAAVDTMNPALVLTDVVLPDGSGVDLCARIKARAPAPVPPVVLLSSLQVSSEAQARGIEAGADGYLAWPVSPRELLARVALALRTPPASAWPGAPACPPALTPRQCDVLRLIALGLTTKEVADRLGIATRTAETHRAALMRRLDVHSTAELLRFAWEHGFAGGLDRPSPASARPLPRTP